MARVIIIDDDHASCLALARLLSGDGHEVDWFTSGEEVMRHGLQVEPNLLICDWILENGLEGLTVARAFWNRWPRLHIFFITGLPVEQLPREAYQLPLVRIFEKPLPLDDLLALVGQLAGGDERSICRPG